MKIVETDKKEPAVLVPIHIEVMVCGRKDNNDYSDIRIQYDRLTKTPSGSSLETSPFSMTDKYSSGVYLHWLLPEGLTHGIQEEEGKELVYPCVPNRYLVTRLSVLKAALPGERITRRDWIIESDLINPPPEKLKDALRMARLYSAVGEESDRETPYRYMGMCREYTNPEKITTKDRLFKTNFTAVCSGTPFFSAYYPMCKNVFSFYDDLSDIDQEDCPAELTYIVSGWYEESPDPLWGEEKGRSCESIKKELFWQWEGMEEEKKYHTVCHGLVSQIRWDGEDQEYPSGIAADAFVPSVVMGHSSSEALAAYICHSFHRPDLERVLESLLEGVLEQWEDTDGSLKAREKIYQGFFKPEAAEEEFSVQGKYSFLQASMKKVLDELNEGRKKAEKEKEAIQRAKEQAYLYWSLAVDGKLTEEAALKKIQRAKDDSKLAEKALEELGSVEAGQKKELMELLASGPKDWELDCQEIPGQNYWEPNDLVILLEGESQSSIYRRLEQYKEEGILSCRLGHELISEVLLEAAVPGEGEKKQFKFQAGKHIHKAKAPLPYYLEEIVEEACLLAESLRRYGFRRLAEEQNWVWKGEKERLHYLEYLDQEYEKQLHSIDNVKGRLPNQTAVYQWKPSWNPLFLEWEVEYTPDPELLKEKYTFKNWELGEYSYLLKNQELLKTSEKKEIYQGRTLLSPHALMNLEEQMKGYMETPCGDIIRRLGGAKILSQCLGGLNHMMLKRDSGAAASIWSGVKQREISQKALGIIGDEAFYRQRETGFYPMRAGLVKLNRIRVVDSFGRSEYYKPDHVILPERVRMEGKNQAMLLSPKILAPVRLWTDWRPMRLTDERQEISPIYGFLWANKYDSCLHIYTPAGKLAGSLQIVYSLKNRKEYRIALRNPPGEVQKEEDLLKELPQQLRGFVTGLYEKSKKNPQILYAFINAIDEVIWNTNPFELKKNPQIMAGLGSPVVLAGMELRVEAKGELPIVYGMEGNKRDCDITSMSFPVRVGESLYQGDGTLGYFEMDGKKDYSRLCLTVRTGAENEYFTYQPCLLTKFSESKSLVLLMLPGQAVHFITGFLPVKTMELLPEQVDAALTQIYMTLYYGPFLSAREKLQMMVPKAMEKEWRFLHFQKPGQPEEIRDIHPTQMEAVDTGKGTMIQEGWLKLMAQKEGGETLE